MKKKTKVKYKNATVWAVLRDLGGAISPEVMSLHMSNSEALGAIMEYHEKGMLGDFVIRRGNTYLRWKV